MGEEEEGGGEAGENGIGYSFITFFFSVAVQIHLVFFFLFSLYIGENTIVIVGEAGRSFQPEEVGGARDLVARAKVVICQLEILPQTTLAALKMAKELGGK